MNLSQTGGIASRDTSREPQRRLESQVTRAVIPAKAGIQLDFSFASKRQDQDGFQLSLE
ncbi:MAG TPA: hypothetical protein VIE67_05310 [Rudaea sp.]|jgi:hypothetical protein|uniref:hypothetical protein n=1 Tax=Rudaea sp. TaxID=2136325 RepID=UPI002F94230F